MPQRVRRFGGQHFVLVGRTYNYDSQGRQLSHTEQKGVADHHAQRYRNRGYNARVVNWAGGSGVYVMPRRHNRSWGDDWQNYLDWEKRTPQQETSDNQRVITEMVDEEGTEALPVAVNETASGAPAQEEVHVPGWSSAEAIEEIPPAPASHTARRAGGGFGLPREIPPRRRYWVTISTNTIPSFSYPLFAFGTEGIASSFKSKLRHEIERKGYYFTEESQRIDAGDVNITITREDSDRGNSDSFSRKLRGSKIPRSTRDVTDNTPGFDRRSKEASARFVRSHIDDITGHQTGGDD